MRGKNLQMHNPTLRRPTQTRNSGFSSVIIATPTFDKRMTSTNTSNMAHRDLVSGCTNTVLPLLSGTVPRATARNIKAGCNTSLARTFPTGTQTSANETRRSGYNNKRTLDAGTRGRTTRRSQDLESTVATRSNYQTDYDIEKNNYFIVICTKKREDTNPSGPSTTVICTGAIAFRCGPYTMYDDCARTRQKHQLLRVSAGQQVVAQGGSLDGWSTLDPPWDYTWGSWACRRLSFPERSL